MSLTVLDAIGHTPIVCFVPPGAAEIWVKLEAHNPTGSYKDRMALAMIEGAEREGLLGPGQTVVEYTGGSTGTSLALVCALKGYPLRIVTSDAFAAEKLATMRAFGARLEVISSPRGITPDLIPSMQRRAAEIVEETGGYPTDQFRNRHMVTRYRALGVEITEQVAAPVDAYCGYIGTAGCFLGVTGALRTLSPEMWAGTAGARARPGGRALGQTTMPGTAVVTATTAPDAQSRIGPGTCTFARTR